MTQLTITERTLRLFTEVKPGEGTTAVMMFANVFLILLAYYFIKPLREGWIAISDVEGLTKMEVKAYSSFAQSILLLFIVGWYARLADRLDRVTLFTRATLFCISNMVIFWFLQPNFFFDQLPLSGIVYYLWVGMFGVFVVAQFWTFCADVYTDERGKRMLPFIAVGATSGAAAGSWIVDKLVDSGMVPTEALLLVATVPLFISILLVRKVEQREDHRGRTANETAPGEEFDTESKPEKASIWSGARLVLVSKFLLLAALVTLLTNWVNTNGENLLFRVIQEALAVQAHDRGFTEERNLLEFIRDGTTAFYGNFYFWVNIIALLLQAFVASRLLKYGGFAAILLILPVIALTSYTVMALLPVLAVVKIMKIAENATDYSLNNTSRHVLWLPVSSAMKFRGKPAIDTLYVRLGDGLAAITVLIGVHLLALTTSEFFVFNVFLVLCWLVAGVLLVREHRRASESRSGLHQAS
ncbi:MAG: Npt1/Npt2 family nucleotide transporter [Pseudomonadota bacterium]